MSIKLIKTIVARAVAMVKLYTTVQFSYSLCFVLRIYQNTLKWDYQAFKDYCFAIFKIRKNVASLPL